MRTFARPASSTVASAIASGSLGSLLAASAIQASNSAIGSFCGAIPLSSRFPPISLIAKAHSTLDSRRKEAGAIAVAPWLDGSYINRVQRQALAGRQVRRNHSMKGTLGGESRHA